MIKKLLAFAVVGLILFVAGVGIGAWRGTRDIMIRTIGDISDLIIPAAPADLNAGAKVELITTALVNFDLEWVNAGAPLPAEGGGMAATEDGVLIARAVDGTLIYLDAETNELQRAGMILPPLNRDKLPNLTPGGKPVDSLLHRYNDIEIVNIAGQDHLLVSYVYFYPDEQCFVSRLAERTMPADWLDRATDTPEAEAAAWNIVFETDPCIEFFEGTRHAIASHQSAGRLAVGKDGKVYMTVGDFEFDGLDGKLPALPQEPNVSYGRVWSFETATWTAEEVSMGHRNHQGITVADDGTIWSVEHGPQGGDELNRIEPGNNYGWPVVTMGVNYGDLDQDDKFWPFNTEQGRHGGYTPPVYSWVPSIAVSNLKQVHGLQNRWDGDLLLGTLNGLSLYRIRMVDGHVLGDERIEIGERLRYVEVAHGHIYLLTDSGLVGVMTPHDMSEQVVALGTQTTGGQVSAAQAAGCNQCHGSPEAPKLSEVFGKDIASQNVTYSDALLAVEGEWDEGNLKAFLTNPVSFAPGTVMPNPGLTPEAVDAIVKELALE
jgi:cytochrome c2